jgi:hypothetical protein
MARWPFSLDLLPVADITNPTANIEFIRGRLTNTLVILDGVLKMPAGLPGDLKQAIFNVRFHVVTALGLIEGALQSGFSYLEPAASVDGLQASVDSHIAALANAQPIWRSWLRSERQQGFGADLPAPMRSRFLQTAAQPVRTGDYVGAGLATLGLYGVSRVPAAFGEGMLNLPPDVEAGLQKIAVTDPLVLEGKVPPPDQSRWMFLGFGVLIGAGLLMLNRKR